MTPAIPSGHDDRGRYVRHVDGRRWYPYDCKPEDVRITDFWALRNVNRFGGRTRYPIPVVCHSLRVLEIVRERGGTREEQWAALVHDAHEVAPPGDVETPMKCRGQHEHGDRGWGAASLLRGLEERALQAYRTWLHTPVATPQVVKEADAQAFAEEWAYLAGPQAVPLYYASSDDRWIHYVDLDDAWLQFVADWRDTKPEAVPPMPSWWEVPR